MGSYIETSVRGVLLSLRAEISLKWQMKFRKRNNVEKIPLKGDFTLLLFSR